MIPLDQDHEVLNKTLDLLQGSTVARQARDRVIASGRTLRVFDYYEFHRLHDEAMHAEKVAALTSSF